MPAMTLRALGAATAATAALSALTLLAAAPANAESGSIGYVCSAFVLPDDFPVDELQDDARRAIEKAKDGDMSALEGLDEEFPFEEIPNLRVTAVFDSAIADDATVPVGSTVELSPLTTTITFPAATVTAALAEINFPVALGGAFLNAGVEELDESREAIFDFSGFSGGDSGVFTATGTGEAESFKAAEAGPHTYVAGDLDIIVGDPQDHFTAFECTLDEGQETAIDQVTAKAAAPTANPSPTTGGPLRPDVVQTDAAQPSNDAGMPSALVTGAALLALAGAAGARRFALRR